jgi:aminopeptidase 2
MTAWTSQPGYPIVTVTEEAETWHIAQSRFVTNPKSVARESKDVWPIPLFTAELADTLLSKKQRKFTFKHNAVPTILNKGQVGFYRVDYDTVIQARQIEALKTGSLSDIDRMGLLSDGFESTRAGYQPVSEYLDLLQHFAQEDSLAVWEIIASSLGSIRLYLSASDTDDTLRDLAKPYVLNLVAPQLKRLGWEKAANEPHLDTLLRPIIIGLAASADHEETVKHALALYSDKVNSGAHLDPDLRSIVYATAARKGNDKTYKELVGLYKNSTSADEKLSLTSAITNFTQPKIHTEVLAFIKSENVRLQDIGYWVAYCFMNRHAKSATWEWFKENWLWLKQSIGTDLSFFRTPVYAARAFYTKEFILEYKTFFSDKIDPQLERSYNQGLEMLETHIAWHARDSKVALDWFKSQQL